MFSIKLVCDGNLKLRVYLTNGSKGKYNLNCRLVKQKTKKPDALAGYKHLQLSVYSVIE